MELPIHFPDEIDVIIRDAEAFRQLSPEGKTAAILDLLSLGASMMAQSPHREAIRRLQEAHEDAWQAAQKDLFKRHGL